MKSREHLSDTGRQERQRALGFYYAFRRIARSQGFSISIWICFAVCLLDAVAALEAQKPDRIAESSLMAQFHQALNMVEHGDEHGALVLTTHLLEQHPDFVPALKLQGMLLEDTGRPTEAALSVRRA